MRRTALNIGEIQIVLRLGQGSVRHMIDWLRNSIRLVGLGVQLTVRREKQQKRKIIPIASRSIICSSVAFAIH